MIFLLCWEKLCCLGNSKPCLEPAEENKIIEKSQGYSGEC